jgi:hypothetical protein
MVYQCSLLLLTDYGFIHKNTNVGMKRCLRSHGRNDDSGHRSWICNRGERRQQHGVEKFEKRKLALQGIDTQEL